MTRTSRYQRLAEYARDAGWPEATAEIVHGWSRSGLLPPARAQNHGESEGTRDQLLALCRLRFGRRIRWHHQLAAQLWVAGYEFEPAVVRAALRRTVDELPRYLARYRGVKAAAHRAPELEAALEDWAASAAGEDGPDGDLLFRGLLDFARLLAGLAVPQPDTVALGHLEQLIGLDHARTDSIGDAGPWLGDAGPGDALIDGARNVRPGVLAAAVDRASAADLEAAREFASWFIEQWMILGQVLGYLPPGFAGLGILTTALDMPDGVALVAAVSLALPRESRAFAASISAELDLEALRAALEAIEARPEIGDRVRADLAAQARRAEPTAAGLAPARARHPGRRPRSTMG